MRREQAEAVLAALGLFTVVVVGSGALGWGVAQLLGWLFPPTP